MAGSDRLLVASEDPDVVRRGRILIQISAVLAVLTIPLFLLTAYEPDPVPGLLALAVLDVTYLASILLARHGRVRQASYLLSGWSMLLALFMIVGNGVIDVAAHFFVIPLLLGFLVLPVRDLLRFAIMGYAVLGIGIIATWPAVPVPGLPPYVPGLSVGVLLAMVGTIAGVAARENHHAHQRERGAEREKIVAEEKVRLRTELFAGLAHDFRNPLTAIVTYTDLMKQELGPEVEQQADLAAIQQATHQLTCLLDDVLDWSRVEAGRIRTEMGPVDLVEWVDDLVPVARPLVVRNGSAFQVDPVPTVLMHTDRNRLSQILLNLLSNAGKFTSRGTVTLQVKQQEQHVLLSVVDSGAGLTQDQLRAIWEPYVRVDDDGHEGTGLGLPLCRRLAGAIGAEIKAVSTPGEGSTFSVVVPLLPPAPALE